jgi:nucleotide-binding universal stress UspA family protein
VIRKILVPLDGSELAETILPQFERIFRVRDAAVVLLRVVPVPRRVTREIEPLIEKAEVEAFDYVTRVAKRLEDKSISAEAVVQKGTPGDVIPEWAAAHGVDLVAMSTHGRSGISRWIRGSVAEAVLRRTTTDLLLLDPFEKPGTEASPRRAPGDARFANLLVPIDEPTESGALISRVTELAKLYDSKVTVFHAIYVPPSLEMYPSEMLRLPAPAGDRIAENVATELRSAGVHASAKTTWGEPAWEILQELRSHPYDLVAMTTHGRRGFERFLLGSVAEKVLRAVTLPLFVVRAGASVE